MNRLAIASVLIYGGAILAALILKQRELIIRWEDQYRASIPEPLRRTMRDRWLASEGITERV